MGLLCTVACIATRANAAATALLIILVAYMVSARLAPPEVDMSVYYELITAFRPYMIKEFLYYSVTSFLYSILQDRSLVFIFLDLAALALLGACMFRELGRTRTIIYLAIFLFSFIGVMGLQNVYRQFLASLFFVILFHF